MVDDSPASEITAMLAAALRAEFDSRLRDDAVNRYSAAMMARGLMILQRQLAGDAAAERAAAIAATGFPTESALAEAIRTRSLTAAQQTMLPEALGALVATKRALSAPDNS